VSRIFVTPAREWPARAADYVIELLQDRCQSEPLGTVSVALAGGATPAAVYRLWNSQAAADFAWDRLYFYLTDERMVPALDPQSNGGMARRHLTRARHWHLVDTTLTAEQAALEYERIVRETVAPASESALPQFDCVLLGVGTDGHTASLFPGSLALAEAERLVAPTRHPQTGQPRVTFTLPLIHAARHVVILVAGNAKAPILKRLLSKGAGPELPAARAAMGARDVVWLVDGAARGRIPAR
jgi:6-phosphogluconolactonase